MQQGDIKKSRFLSRVLRHRPGDIGITLDAQGWTSIDDLLARSNGRLTRKDLHRVVAENDKQRFAISPDGQRIRANQGHSVDIDLGLAPSTPPETLFHGTADRFLVSIRQEGLTPRSRQHVHLSTDVETAIKVGQRYGTPVVLNIRAGKLHRQGQVFHVSENGVWLTSHVPVGCIGFPVESDGQSCDP